MLRQTLLASAFALLLAGPLAMAQDAPAAPTAQAKSTTPVRPMPHPGHAPMNHRMDRAHPMRMRHDARGGAFADLRALERLYRESGREKELAGVYNDVLAKTQEPRLRSYVYHRLARLQARPANLDQAIATLRKSLSENLANEAKRHAERERMRAQWQQRKAATAR